MPNISVLGKLEQILPSSNERWTWNKTLTQQPLFGLIVKSLVTQKSELGNEGERRSPCVPGMDFKGATWSRPWVEENVRQLSGSRDVNYSLCKLSEGNLPGTFRRAFGPQFLFEHGPRKVNNRSSSESQTQLSTLEPCNW